ncbi:hypothetical protein COBT_001676 [Conglomerata obtusa]
MQNNTYHTDDEIIKLIKTHDIDFIKDISLDHKFQDGTKLIHQACLYGHFDLLLYIISKEVDINEKGGKHESTPLFYTIYNWNVDLTFILLEAGADVNIKNGKGFGILHYCMLFDNILAFVMLIQFGAKFDEVDSKNRNVNENAILFKKYRFLQVIKKYKTLNIKQKKHENDIILHRRVLKENEQSDDKKTNYSKQIEKKKTIVYKFLVLPIYNVFFLFIPFTIAKYVKRLFNFDYKINAKELIVLAFTTLLHLASLIISILFLYPLFYLMYYYRRRLMDYNYFLIVNLLYLSLYFKHVIVYDFSSIILLYYYAKVLFNLIAYKAKSNHKNILESKKIITNLIKNEQYNLVHFCYVCWNIKEFTTIHCHLCKNCIRNYDHHCSFLGVCIDDTNMSSFLVYLFATFLILFYQSEIIHNEIFRTHFKLLTLFVIIQCLNRISIIADTNK